MKFEIIRIHDCVDCPHKEWEDERRICRKAGDRTINEFIGELPDWCPLNDIELLTIEKPDEGD